MPETVLLIQHMDDGREDRVARHLRRRGFALDWRNPARGDALPRNPRNYSAAVVYGGSQSANDAAELAWLNSAAHMLSAPGAHPRERQEADARRYERPMQAWLTGFIDAHLLPVD